MRRVLIVNPRAGAGRMGRKLDALHRAIVRIAGPIELMPTQHRKHASELAAQAVRQGATEVWSLGGDGTHSEVVAGLESVPESSDVALGVLHGGTGGDFSRMLGRGSLEVQVRRLLADEGVWIDLGEARWMNGGQEQRQVFLNELSMGMSATICARVNSGSKRLGGRISFLAHTLRTLVDFQPHDLQLTVDGEVVEISGVRTTLACNGRWGGGGMLFAPEAQLDDGQLNVIVLLDSPVHRAVRQLPRLYDGSITASPDVRIFCGSALTLASQGTQQHLEADGEVLGKGSVSIAVIPKRLRLLGLDRKRL